jgi:hypothetical protein
MLEDMPEDIGIDLGLEVVLGEFGDVLFEQRIGDLQTVEQGIFREKPSVVSMDFSFAGLHPTAVHVAEVFLESVIQRTVLVHLGQPVPLLDDLGDGIGRK